MFWTVIYNSFIVPVLWLIMQLMRLYNPKVRDRENNWKRLLSHLEKFNRSDNSKIIWFHASSMGEFEQAKPVIELLKKKNSNIRIVVTFYSPSGYNNQKHYKFADAILYMPFDSGSRARKLIGLIKPDIVVFIRYEIWRNHLWQLKKKSIPIYLICATAPVSKLFRKFPLISALIRSNYNLFDKIFSVSENESNNFKKMKIKPQLITASDTRFDRIIEKVNEAKQKPILPKELFSQNKLVIVAGSTWEPDEDIIINSIIKFEKENHQTIRLIIVPHEPTDKHIEKLKHNLPNSFLLSEVLNFLSYNRDENEIKNFLGWNHIIVDSIGHLLGLYSLADASYTGGGFGAGVHSVTEPAGYGIPLSAGVKYSNSPDAVSLHHIGALKIIKNSIDLYEWLNILIKSNDIRKEYGSKAFHYVNKHTGSTKIIADELISLKK